MIPREANMSILQIGGQQALSAFKLEQFLSRVQAVNFSVKSLQANYIYFVAHTSPLSTSQLEILSYLVDGGPVCALSELDNDSILVVPRIGTISPWSTKATDILNRCGFDAVYRIERGITWKVQFTDSSELNLIEQIGPIVHDRMTESIFLKSNEIKELFKQHQPQPLRHIDILGDGIKQLGDTNKEMGLALSDEEIKSICDWYRERDRNPTDAELMMYSQINSEHCRHKIFNALWTINGRRKNKSLFSMIRESHECSPQGTLVAYEDNASVIEGCSANRFMPDCESRLYAGTSENAHIIYKAETHNHPTAISPFPGAATGAGGEIRDEGATGRAGKPKAGLCGFSVSNLRIPEFALPWEGETELPKRIASSLQIMLEAPIGAASFNNEFGRPNIGGYFRTFEMQTNDKKRSYGYHKPIMFAGGIGNIRPSQVEKKKLEAGALLVVIGGPAMLIGLGGGAASSLGQGQSGEELDFASVQRSNPEMQRRCQEVIDHCASLGNSNPILSIHDVGAGGLSNALPEIIHSSGLGGEIMLRDILNDDLRMSPMEIWCNESQERYVLAVANNEDWQRFKLICERERCPVSTVGRTTALRELVVTDQLPTQIGENTVIDLEMGFLLDSHLQSCRETNRYKWQSPKESEIFNLTLEDCIERVLCMPCVGDKSFLITIGDRTVSGLVHRDQMVGPWQVPVADAAITLADYETYVGEAMAIGERAPVAVVDVCSSVRMAIGEALMNIRSTSVNRLSDIKLSANWMVAANVKGEEAKLYDAVESASEMCKALSLSIPVGKDSMSMKTEWTDSSHKSREVFSPISLVVTAFTALSDVRSSLTPQLLQIEESELLLIDLGQGYDRLGMSCLFQAFDLYSGLVPDVNDFDTLKRFYKAITALLDMGLILAYHDRSDGGLFACLCEMAFAGRTGLDIQVGARDPIPFLFNEELGAVIQVKHSEIKQVMEIFSKYEIEHLVHNVGVTLEQNIIRINSGENEIYKNSRTELHRAWSETSWRMQTLRDNSETALQEYDRILDESDPGLHCKLPNAFAESPPVIGKSRPTIAIMREQGVNGHVEMAAAFTQAGFDAYDVMMSDLTSGDETLTRFHGLAMCGGFSFGDVLGAGKGWASTILFNEELKSMFTEFFRDESKFALGVCNGCQVMASLKDIIPGAEHWPEFLKNVSEQFEARLAMVDIAENKSVLTDGMQHALVPVAVAHGEGKAVFSCEEDYLQLKSNGQIVLRYADNQGRATMKYPCNPNGSEYSVAGITNQDGRITAMMPHPERVFRSVQYSWAPSEWGEYGPWMELFRNSFRWLSD